ncbi:MAG: hypothetical protein GY696_30665 [Gammaproteobacteria bacterium]|nr:hypothetical protein [Gammaproteobacteria bacterium]
MDMREKPPTEYHINKMATHTGAMDVREKPPMEYHINKMAMIQLIQWQGNPMGLWTNIQATATVIVVIIVVALIKVIMILLLVNQQVPTWDDLHF